MQYINSRKNESLGFPPLLDEEKKAPETRRMGLDELPLMHQIEQSLAVIGERHPRVANAINTFWGFKEGEDYLKKLIFDGSDPKSHIREGFRPEVLAALLTLQSLHVVARR